jgi:hypothetical protein
MNSRLGRPRKSGRKNWPSYMYKNSGGTFWHRNPATGEICALGKTEGEAINTALRLNRLMGALPNCAPDTDDRDPVESDGLLSRSHVDSHAMPIENAIGIYFLIAAKEVVYVGQSMNCARRILEHVVDPRKNFDSYFVLRCNPSCLDELERRYVAKFHPILNINIPGGRQARAALIVDAN